MNAHYKYTLKVYKHGISMQILFLSHHHDLCTLSCGFSTDGVSVDHHCFETLMLFIQGLTHI